MRSVLVTQSLSTAGGGVSLAVLALGGALTRSGGEISAVALADDGKSLPCDVKVDLRLCAVDSRFPIPRSASLKQALQSSSADLFHVHGLWADPSWTVPEVARRRAIPWIVSPHGMLDPWALANSRWKKRIAATLFENRNLKGAACLHALCESEADSIRAYGLTQRIEIIPNGVDLPALRPRADSGNRRQRLLFLGRLHPKKGLIPALQAWSKLKTPGWQLLIAGWDQGGHADLLKKLCTEGGISFVDCPAADWLRQANPEAERSDVVFLGAAFGAEKEHLLASTDAFFLPSFSEGLPMAVLEAWSFGLPVLMTSHCNLPEGFAAGAALECSTDPVRLQAELTTLFSMDDVTSREMGARGRSLVEERFTWPAVASRMTEVYSGLIAG